MELETPATRAAMAGIASSSCTTETSTYDSLYREAESVRLLSCGCLDNLQNYW